MASTAGWDRAVASHEQPEVTRAACLGDAASLTNAGSLAHVHSWGQSHSMACRSMPESVTHVPGLCVTYVAVPDPISACLRSAWAVAGCRQRLVETGPAVHRSRQILPQWVRHEKCRSGRDCRL